MRGISEGVERGFMCKIPQDILMNNVEEIVTFPLAYN
jgi:hypothetical protein